MSSTSIIFRLGFFAVVVVALCGLSVAPSHAQTNSADAALTQLRQEAQTKAGAAKVVAARLTPAQREEAQQLFSTAFELAQQQKYETAKLGFQRGLAIDPSNGKGEYFLAEVLIQLNDPAAALPHYALAQVLAPNTAEGLDAEVQMGKLAVDSRAPLQVGQIWNFGQTDDSGAAPDSGRITIAARIDATHYKGQGTYTYLGDAFPCEVDIAVDHGSMQADFSFVWSDRTNRTRHFIMTGGGDRWSYRSDDGKYTANFTRN